MFRNCMTKESIDMKFVAIANPGIKEENGYKYYDQTIKERLAINECSEL